MKTLAKLASILLLTGSLFAQRAGPFTITATTGSHSCASIAIAIDRTSTVTVDVSGTFSATLQPQVAMAGQAAHNIQVTPTTSQTPQSTITAAGGYQALQVSGWELFQVCATAYASGTATVYLSISSGSVAILGSGGGGGGDTITSPNNTLAVGGSAAATTLDLNGAAGEIMAGATPALTATPALGTDNSVAGTLTLANSAAAAHTIFASGATTTNTIKGFAAVPTTGHIVTCTVASTTCTLTDGGAVPTGTVTSIATTSPITGGTITGSGTIACATCGVTGSPLSQFAGTTSAQFFGVISDETGTGVVVGSNSPTLVTPLLGTPTSGVITNLTGTCGSCTSNLAGGLTGTPSVTVNALTATTFNSGTKCAASDSSGTVSCSAAPSGSFSCGVGRSGSTCIIATTAVTANSAIFVQPDSSLGTLLSVTCTTTADTGLTAPRVSARSANTSFTITLGIYTNSLCFNYWVIN